MLSPAEMRKVNVQLTRGMRRNWTMGTQAMMTNLRVLPDELYEKVVSGKGEVPPGASVPDIAPEVRPGHAHGASATQRESAAGEAQAVDDHSHSWQEIRE